MKTKTFKVELRMFYGGAIRKVTVPAEKLSLDKSEIPNQHLDMIFFYGQNEIQPAKQPSVSAGDVIRYGRDRYLILVLGFKRLKKGEYVKPVALVDTAQEMLRLMGDPK